MKRIICALIASVALLFVGTSPASAHGEEAQEAWLRMNSISWWNVQFSGGAQQQNGDFQLKSGDEFKITGTAKVLESWPKTLGKPETAFINVVAPGPVVLVKNRVINGQQAPHSIFIEEGNVYNFEITLQARIPGRYHIHPTFSVQGAGTLIGPGQWFDVQKGDKKFVNELTLYNGKTINLENYKVWWVFLWTLGGFILGMWLLLYWIVPYPTVSRLAVTSQLSVNDDGGEAVGLISKKDHRMMDAIMLSTIAFVVIGLIWQASAFPRKLPLQVQRVRIDSALLPAEFAKATPDEVVLDEKTNTYAMKVSVTNTGTDPMTVKAVHIANITLLPAANAAVSPSADVPANQVAIAPGAEVAPGATTQLTLRLPRAQLDKEQLIPRANANTNVTAVLEVAKANGDSNFITLQRNLSTIFALGR